MVNLLKVKVLKIDQMSIVPKKAHEKDAASDIYALEDFVVPSSRTIVARTGFCLEMPSEVYGRIETRSSLAAKGVFTTGGIIDSGYRDEILVILNNSSPEAFVVHRGDRIAQILFHRVEKCEFIVVPHLEMNDDRGGGLGSTGH